MEFKNFESLINKIEQDLGAQFKNNYRTSRKHLAGLNNLPNQIIFSEFDSDKSQWVYNRGGKKEIQYHIFLREGEIGYGLGINSQRGSFNNDDPAEIANAFGRAFQQLYDDIIKILPNYSFTIGSKDKLGKMNEEEFLLFGNSIPCSDNNYMEDVSYNSMIEDLKIQLEVYKMVFELRNKNLKYDLFKNKYMKKLQESIGLLKYKKQIILQGPPGTGKTYTAKQIAKQIAGCRSTSSNKSLTPDEIKKRFKVGQKIANASGVENYYTVNAINDDTIEIQSNRSQPWKPTYEKIIAKYNQLLAGETPSNTNAFEPYELAVAKYLHATIKLSTIKTESNYSLVQFHPSYSYEDFVRGISVKNENGTIVYNTENKIIAELSELASRQNNIEDYNIAKLYSSYLIEKTLEYQNTGKVYYLNKEKTIRLLDVHHYNGEIGNLRYETLSNSGQWYMQTWIAIENNYDLANWKDSNRHSALYYDNKEHYEIWKHFDAFVKRLQNTNYVLIIDEINRANLSSVLGELIYALEYRGENVDSMYAKDGKTKISIPDNLYIIGTMNTADRSVGQIDYAIRRRFAFVDVLPQDLTNDTSIKFQSQLFHAVKALFTNDDDFKSKSEYISEEFEPKDVALGHSYFIQQKDNDGELIDFKLRLDYEIKPILLEYIKDGILKESARTEIEKLKAS